MPCPLGSTADDLGEAWDAVENGWLATWGDNKGVPTGCTANEGFVGTVTASELAPFYTSTLEGARKTIGAS